MGILDLNKFLKKRAPNCKTTIPVSKFSGTRIAIDANNMFFSKMYTATLQTYDLLQLKIDPFAQIDRTEAEKKWYAQLLYLILTFTSYGITPVFVIDGKHLPAKAKTQSKRREDKRKTQQRADTLAADIARTPILEREDKAIEKLGKTKSSVVYITSEQITTFKSVLNMIGIPVITALGDGEDLCCALANEGKVSAVYSRDTDCYLQSPITISGITKDTRSPNHTFDVTLYDRILSDLGMSRENFIDLAILGGCDYNEGVPGIMITTAYKLFMEHKTIENIIKYDVDHDYYGDEGMNLNLDFCRSIFRIKSVVECLDPSHDRTIPSLDINKMALQHFQTRPFLTSLGIDSFIMKLDSAYRNVQISGDFGAEYILEDGRILPKNFPTSIDIYVLRPIADPRSKREVLELHEKDLVDPVNDMIRFD